MQILNASRLAQEEIGRWTDTNAYEPQVNSDTGGAHTTGSTDFGYDYTFFGESSGYWCTWIRFPSIILDQAQEIISATLTLYKTNGNAGTSVNIRVYGNDVDSAVVPGNVAGYNALALTGEYVDWNSVPVISDNTAWDAINVTAIIQEIIDRGSWASGNAVMLLIKNNGSSSGCYRFHKNVISYPTQRPILTIIA